MGNERSPVTAVNWRAELPVLAGRVVTLREPDPQDLGTLGELLSAPDASRFGLEPPVTTPVVEQFIERMRNERSVGLSFSYVVLTAPAHTVAGLIQVRQLDPAFETGEWECTLAPAARGGGAFIEVAQLVGSFAFGPVGAHRLEARVLLQNGRANGALRKLGAVQEGILRRSVRRGGEFLDQVLWSVLKDDWNAQWIPATPRIH